MRILNRVKGFLISRTTSPVFKGCGDNLVVLYAKLLLRGVFFSTPSSFYFQRLGNMVADLSDMLLPHWSGPVEPSVL